MKECDIYQRMKNRTEMLVEKLKLSEVPEKLWIYLMVDFIMKLLIVAGKNVILVVCDRLSKITHFVATIEETLAEGLVRLFRDNMQKLHRLPESIVLEKGLQFAAEIIKELNNMLGIKTKLSTAFHPQIDGQIKRMNQELEQYLRFFIDYRQKDWPEWLASVKFVINNKAYLTTKISLFMENYGRELRIRVNLKRKGKMEKAIKFVERIRKVQKKAKVALT